MQLERKERSQSRAQIPRLSRNSECTISRPGVLPAFKQSIASISCSLVIGPERSLVAVWQEMVSLMLTCTHRLRVLNSWLWSFHFPFLTKIEAIELVYTEQGFGLLLWPMRQLMVNQAFLLECVKSIELTVPSHLAHLFSLRMFNSVALFSAFSWSLTALCSWRPILHL